MYFEDDDNIEKELQRWGFALNKANPFIDWREITVHKLGDVVFLELHQIIELK